MLELVRYVRVIQEPGEDESRQTQDVGTALHWDQFTKDSLERHVPQGRRVNIKEQKEKVWNPACDFSNGVPLSHVTAKSDGEIMNLPAC